MLVLLSVSPATGVFDILVDVRKADDYAVGHIPGAYNAPGLAVLDVPITDALPSNLWDCTAKIVAVLPCVVLEPNPNPDPNSNQTTVLPSPSA